ncbi:hypothetical protein CHELA1G11_14437 [Hyphomicrobiales bacterium]|nr:hypothetical protein CHELA1G11_14437 [Hyphomicrobiales bacterium]
MSLVRSGPESGSRRVAKVSRESLTFAREFCDNAAFGIGLFQINGLRVKGGKPFWPVAKIRILATDSLAFRRLEHMAPTVQGVSLHSPCLLR